MKYRIIFDKFGLLCCTIYFYSFDRIEVQIHPNENMYEIIEIVKFSSLEELYHHVADNNAYLTMIDKPFFNKEKLRQIKEESNNLYSEKFSKKYLIEIPNNIYFTRYPEFYNLNKFIDSQNPAKSK